MKRIALAVGIIVAGACSGEKPVDPDNPKTCAVACGVGFVCEEARCVLAPETVVEADLLSPVADAWLNEPEVTFECRVKAPQVSRVFVRVTGEGAEPSEVALEKVAAQDSWTATEEIGEGSLSAVCVVEFGPAGATVLHESEAVAFRVAVGGPRVILNPVEGWFGEDAVVEVSASQDPGVEIKSARLEVPSVALLVIGDREGALGWRFPVKVLSLTQEQVETEFPFDVYFEDPAGNEAKASSVIKVDTIKPRPTIVADSTWLQADGTAAVTVTVVDGSDVESVSLSIEGKSFAGVRSGSGWKFSLALGDVVDAVTQGSVSFVVAAVDAAGNVGSAEGALLVDGVAPSIELEPLNAWYRRDSTLTVRANITEGGGINPASVVLRMGEGQFPGTDDGEGAWVFEVPLAEVTDANIEALVDFSVAAADLAGNITVESFQVGVDAKPPAVKILDNPDASWTASAFNLRVQVATSGAPLVLTRLAGQNGMPAMENQGSDADVSFAVKPTDWQGAGQEGVVPWTLTATDAAGNTATVSGGFKLDLKPPSIDTGSPSGWFNTSTVEVRPVVSDSGSGPSQTFLEWEADGMRDSCSMEGGAWKCMVVTPSAPGVVDANYPFTIRAKDSVGNAASAVGRLKVDKKGPVVSLVSDGKWYKRSDVIRVRANVADPDSGLGSKKPVLAVNSPIESVHEGMLEGPVAIFDIPATAVVAAGGTAGNVGVTLTVFDAIGNATEVPANNQFRVDDTPPSILIRPPVYDPGRTNVANRDPFGRGRSTATVEVVVVDSGVGLDSVELNVGLLLVSPVSVSGDTYVYRIDAESAVTEGGIDLFRGEGEFSFTVKASDVFGKRRTQQGKISYSRVLWSSKSNPAAPVSALAIAGNRVFSTHSRSGGLTNIEATDRGSGATVWSTAMSGKPLTAPSINGKWLFVGTDEAGGTIERFELSSGSSVASRKGSVSGVGTGSGDLATTDFVWGGSPDTGDWSPIPTVFWATDDNRIKAYSIGCLFSSCFFSDRADVSTGISASSWGSVAINGSAIYFGNSSARVARATPYRYDESASMYAYRLSMSTTPSASTPYGTIKGLALSSSVISYASGNALHRWSLDLGARTPLPYDSSGSSYNPIVLGAGDRSFFTSLNGYLYHQSSSGVAPSRQWMYGTPSKVSPVIGHNSDGSESIYVAHGPKALSAYDAGSMQGLWSLTLDAEPTASPVLDCNGILYVASSTGQFYAVVTDSVGLSKSAWPRYQHDNRNTGDYSYKTWNGNTCID